MKTTTPAQIHAFLASPMSGADIEAASFATIDREAPEHHFSAEQWEVVRRMIHTTADFGLVETTCFSPDAIDAARQALEACRPIYVDANMTRAGLSGPRLRSVHPSYGPEQIICHVADVDVAMEAGRQRLPRSLFALRKASDLLQDAIVVIGNAPVALLELNRLVLEEGIRPALVIGVPVGFVHVVESKEELMSLGVPYITVRGRRGGSTLAVSIVHALCTVAQVRRRHEVQ